MAQYGLMELPLNLDDASITAQPVAAGVTAATSSKDLAGEASGNLDGLEDQVEKFYNLAKTAEANQQNIEKFLLGASCKTSAVPAAFLCLRYKPGNFI